MTPEENQNIDEIIEEVSKILGAIADLIADAFGKVIDKIAEFCSAFEPYMIFELKHPRKKPRGSIRRARKRGKR